MKQISASVLSNRKVVSLHGTDYYLMRIEAPEIVQGCKPGQFIMLKCGEGTLLRRPISIHSVAVPSELELLYAVNIRNHASNARTVFNQMAVLEAGAGTSWLSRLTGGAYLDVIGPLGNSFTIEPASSRCVIIAGGIGIAPLRFLAEHLIKQGKETILMIGARTAAGILPDNMLPAVANKFIATEDGSLGKKGRILDFIPEFIRSADQVFACGPVAMYEALASLINSWPAAKPVQVSLEVRMGCGAGICYSCSIKTKQGIKRVCKEGPVFNIKDIIWQEVRT